MLLKCYPCKENSSKLKSQNIDVQRRKCKSVMFSLMRSELEMRFDDFRWSQLHSACFIWSGKFLNAKHFEHNSKSIHLFFELNYCTHARVITEKRYGLFSVAARDLHELFWRMYLAEVCRLREICILGNWFRRLLMWGDKKHIIVFSDVDFIFHNSH